MGQGISYLFLFFKKYFFIRLLPFALKENFIHKSIIIITIELYQEIDFVFLYPASI
jgi:hypothetical protein